MDMNREAVNTALGLAGCLPMTDADKKYNNLVYALCKQLYLSVLFTSLCALDWRSGRKDGPLMSAPRRAPNDGRYYYGVPAHCAIIFLSEKRGVCQNKNLAQMLYVVV